MTNTQGTQDKNANTHLTAQQSPSVNFSECSYKEQLQQKLEPFQERLSHLYSGPIDTFESEESGYRMRAEFKVWHEHDETYYVMHHPSTKETYRVEHFSPAHIAIQQRMPLLRKKIEQSEQLRRKLFSAEFLTSNKGETIITLIYHKPLDDQWQDEATQLGLELDAYIIGRSRKQKRIIGQDFVTETLTVGNREYHYRQYEGAFSQPNWAVNSHMVSWAQQQATLMSGDLLELYCGNGNFTLPLSTVFDRVLTTEISKVSIRALQWAVQENTINNVDCARLSAEECSEALDRVRPFRRLAHLDLDQFNFTTVFVDPPRAGLDPTSLKFISRFQNIIYISCNPLTLMENLTDLSSSHEVVAAAAFDQFPFTHHLEAGVILKKS